MKRSVGTAFSIVAALVVVAAIVWLSGPRIALWLRENVLATLDACRLPAGEACANAFAQLGQAGDLFGSFSALFSGLALIAIAVTIWFDVSSRRASRKPLVVCQVSEERPVILDDPNTALPRAIRIGFDLEVHALNDVALNVTVAPSLTSSKWRRAFDPVSVPVPLPDSAAPQKIGFTMRLDSKDVESFVTSHQEDGRIGLAVEAEAESLEGIRWKTSVAYELKFRPADKDKIEALIADEAICQQHWANQTTVQAEHTVSPGTWRHRKTKRAFLQ